MGNRIRRKLSESTKFKMSLAKQGKRNPMYGRKHAENVKRKISKALIDYWRNIPTE